MIPLSPCLHRLQKRIFLVLIPVVFCPLFFLPVFVSAGTLTIDADSQFRFARRLFDEGKFEQAATEFDRFIYFFPDDDRVQPALFLEGRSFFNAKRFGEAKTIFSRMVEQASEGEYTSRASLMIAACQFQLNDAEGAVASLEQLIRVTGEPAVRDEAWYQLAWFRIETADWQKAKSAFHQLSREGNDKYQSQTVLSALEAGDTIPGKNPGLAGFLSLIPGAGHLYCDRPRDATIAFLLNTALAASAWQAFDKDMPWLGGLISFVEIGVYSGTLYSAVSSAHKYNRQATRGFIEQLKRLAPPVISLGPAPGGLHLSLTIDF